MSFPAVTEDVKWESNLCFCIGDKIFCIANLEPPHTFSFKVADEEFDELSATKGFKPAPYLARAKWIFVSDSARLSRSELKDHLHKRYELIKAKLSRKNRKDLGLE